MDIKKTVSKMSLKDKIDYCTGADFWRTKGMKKYNIDSVMMADGPHGVRCQPGKADMIGINNSLEATCFPTAVTSGATWNPSLIAKVGEAIGKEGLGSGVSIVLGPGCNIKRNPLGGRNFEYFSEDPYVAGKMSAAFINGQQSTGAMSCIKHFAVNSQEFKRQNSDSIIDERALREIYLKPFEIAVKESSPATLMCAYNKINGIHCSDSKELLTDILREEWGFDGAVITDWGALNNRIDSFKAGCDLNMPGGARFMHKAALKAVEQGELSESCVDQSVERILNLVSLAKNQKTPRIDYDSHHDLARKVAEQGAVLLKNEDNILPFSDEDVALFGALAENMRYQGAGSSHINPKRLVSVTDALPDAKYFACSDVFGNANDADLEKAKAEAKKCKVAVVVIGLPEKYESEAFDRAHMRLPDGYNRLVECVAKVNPNTVVVLVGGSVMELPWADSVKAILYMGLSGQAGGEAVANLLYGKAVPSGKLTETWPISYEDVVSRHTFGKKNTEYRESVFVGYRYYSTANVKVRYPFGYGLSYTQFEYSDLSVGADKVSFTVTNVGKVKGAEVVQLYITPPKGEAFRPCKELKAFERIELAAGESATVSFDVCDDWFTLWQNGFKKCGGDYTVLLGSSSEDIRLCALLHVSGEKLKAFDVQKGTWYETLKGLPDKKDFEKLLGREIPEHISESKGSFTLDNTCLEMKDSSLIMKFIYNCTKLYIALKVGGKRDDSNTAYRMMIICATDCPLRVFVINGGGIVTDGMAKLLLRFANGLFPRKNKANDKK